MSPANKIGIAATIGAGACFIRNDALVKHVSAQLIFIRGVFAVLILGLATLCYLTALAYFVVTMATALSVTLFAGLCSIYQGWKPVTQDALLSLALASMFLSVAYFLMVKSMRAGDMAVIAPFRYSSLPFALLLISGLLMMRRKASV